MKDVLDLRFHDIAIVTLFVFAIKRLKLEAMCGMPLQVDSSRLAVELQPNRRRPWP